MKRSGRLRSKSVLMSDPASAPTSEVGFVPNMVNDQEGTSSQDMSALFSSFMQNLMQKANNNEVTAKRTLKPCEVFIPVFDPDECNTTALQWCEEVDNHKNQNNWTDYEKKNVALTHLRGRAQKWAKHSHVLCKTWEDVMTRLPQYFATTKRFHDLFSDMVSYTSDKAPSYVEYATNQLALIERLESSWTESNKVELVIYGIKDHHIHSELLKNTPSDFLTLERHLSTYGKVRYYNETFETEPDNFKRRKVEENNNVKRCFNCGQSDHVKKHCKRRSALAALA